jgi:hypothetical protein
MDNYDFEKIPLWKDGAASFDILTDHINGRIPVTRLENWKDLLSLLESDFFNQNKAQLIFRGHRRYDWALMPTLARIPESGIIDEELAQNQLDHFKKAVRGRLTDYDLVHDGEEDELWAVGQHHGLMTPLLDWTHSPYVALFFAFSKEDSEEEKENGYRAIYVLNKTFVADDMLCPDIRMFEPRKDSHGRLVNQAGLFTFSPYGSTIENKLIDTLTDENFPNEELKNASLSVDEEGVIQDEVQAGILAKYICKIYIKNEDRDGCMRHLRRMNVHHASLFPDLIGASEYCNAIMSEERRITDIEASSEIPVLNKDIKRVAENFLDSNSSLEEVELQVSYILFQYDDNKTEPKKLNLLGEHISKGVQKLRLIDWYKRESAIASIRSYLRITLRKYAYPEDKRSYVASDIVDYLMSQDNPKETPPEE